MPRPDPATAARVYEEVTALVKPASVVAVSVNTAGLDDEAAALFVRKVASETGLPTADPFRPSISEAGPLLDAILAAPKGRTSGETGK